MRRVAHAVAAGLDLSEETRRQYEEDAGALSFDRVTDMQLDQLRLRVAAALVASQGAPRAAARSMKGNSAR